MKPLIRFLTSASAAFVLLAHFTGCLGSEPKVLGDGIINFDAVDTTNDENFKFNFAYLDTTLAAPHNTTVTLQGAEDAQNAIIAACNSAGTSCVCEFLDNAGVELEESASGFIQYDSTGNYIRCSFTGATPRKVRLRNIASTKVSATLSIKNPSGGTDPITVQELLTDKNLNDLRTVYIYDCLFNFLQKKNATALSFDCTDQAANPCDGGTSELCILQAPYPYYLFADNQTNNFSLKIADLLYNNGSTDRICNNQIKRIDCTGTTGTPQKHFGLYAEQTGIYQTPVALGAGPGVAEQNYGFAAELDSYLGVDICPPGLIPFNFYEAEPDETSMEVGVADGINDNNIQDAFFAISLDNASGPSVPSLEFTQLTGGDCDGTTCSVPTTNNGTLATFNYTQAAGTSTFCVIPKEIIP